jgi:hypothetical protein
MRAFTCPVCRHLVTFESTECLHCGTALAFDWDAREIVRLDGACANRDLIACNGEGEGLCAACRLTRTRPTDDVITLDLAEADPVVREQRRTQLHEPYRTLLGHVAMRSATTSSRSSRPRGPRRSSAAAR